MDYAEEFRKAQENLNAALSECMVVLMLAESDLYKEEKLMDYDLVIGVGETQSPISDKEYQIQLSLIRNKKMWVDEDEVQRRVATNIVTEEDVNPQAN